MSIPYRQEVLLNMSYHLDIPRFLKFIDMIKALRAGDVDGVCREMKDSVWYKEVKGRADRVIEKYRQG